MHSPHNHALTTLRRKASRLRRLRQRYRWLDHLVRAADRYVGYHGYHYVASITYFSLLSLIPMLMVGFSVAGFVLAGEPELLRRLQDSITEIVPGPLVGNVRDLVSSLIEQRTKVGVFGLVIGLYSGWNWMNALRDALTGMWNQERPTPPLLRTIVVDLLALLGLVAALLVSFGLSAAGGALSGLLLRLTQVDQTAWAPVLLGVGSVVLALFADTLVFLWVLAKLPREPVGLRSTVRGAVAAAIGFELLKQAGNIYLGLIGSSPTGATFGSVIGLIFFISLVSRLLVFITAWTATARDAPAVAAAPPKPVVLRAESRARVDPAVPALAGVLTGIVGTVVLQRHWRRREPRD